MRRLAVRRLGLAATGLVFVGIAAAWLVSRPGGPGEERASDVARGAAPSSVPVAVTEPRVAEAVPSDAAVAPASTHLHAHEESPPDPFGDLAYYEEYPLSDVPHRVVRGWGVGPRSPRPGTVGALVVVEPDLGRAELTRLVRDIRAYHHQADILAIRILDSMEAATYDRHEDGGALLAESLVGSVQRNEELGLDTAEVLGEPIDGSGPSEGAGGAEGASDTPGSEAGATPAGSGSDVAPASAPREAG